MRGIHLSRKYFWRVNSNAKPANIDRIARLSRVDPCHFLQPMVLESLSGCIRMATDDGKHLDANVDVGTKVVVLR